MPSFFSLACVLFCDWNTTFNERSFGKLLKWPTIDIKK